MKYDGGLRQRLAGFRRHSLVGIYGLAGLFVVAWTLLSFFSRPTIYDLVTQQLVARSWLHGNFAPITFGTTHYLFKVIFLYMPMELLPGSPRLKLILLTLLVNLLTFLLIALVLQKILAEFGLRVDKYLAIAMLWLSVIAGSVFWIGFTNSRNLEVAGGLYLLYLGLRLLEHPTRRLLIGLSVFAGLLFFADRLQVFMMALPLLVYGSVIYHKAADRRRVYVLLVALLAGYVFADSLFWLASRLFSVTFTGGNVVVHLVTVADVYHALKATGLLFIGTFDITHAGQLINLVFLVSMSALFVLALRRGRVARRLSLLIGLFALVDELVYIFSGQASQDSTSRYLIMLAPLAVLAFVVLQKSLASRRYIYAGFAGLVALNAVLIASALYKNWDTSFSQDRHLYSIARYLTSHHEPHAYASMDTSLPVAYYHIAPATTLVPLACDTPRLVHASSVPQSKTVPVVASLVPLLLDRGNQITNVPAVCTRAMIISQLGAPLSSDTTDDGSLVLLYPASVLMTL